jgi:menaquinone-9 beta-reductase
VEPYLRIDREEPTETPDVASRTWDVIVIGAGPAGALSALLSARSGAATLLIERKRFPRLKVCGGCLNASAVGLLGSLGLGGIASEFGLPIDHLELGLRGKRAKLELPGGVAIPRTHLDAELVRHAREAGAEFLPETCAVLGKDAGLAREVALTTHGREQVVMARCVVVASGLGGSAMGDEGAFSTRVARGSRLGAGCVVETDPAPYARGGIAMAIGRSGYVGLTPTIDGLAIASATSPAFLKSQGGPARAAAAIFQEAGFPPVPGMLSAEWSGTLPLTRSTRPVAASRVFLVGDAAGYIEPFTGQGMAIALQGAVALAPHVARAIAAWSPAVAKAWSRDYARQIASRHWPAALVAAIVRRPLVAGLAFALAGAMPAAPGALVRIVNRPVLTHSSS